MLLPGTLPLTAAAYKFGSRYVPAAAAGAVTYVCIALVIIAAAVIAVETYMLLGKKDEKKDLSSLEAFSRAAETVAMGLYDTPLPLDDELPELASIAKSIETLTSGLIGAVTGEFAANEKIRLYNGLLEDVQGTYSAQDVLQALCERIGNFLMLDRVSIIDHSIEDADPVVLAYWKREGAPDFSMDIGTMAVLRGFVSDREDVTVIHPESQDGEYSMLGLPPDVKSLCAVALHQYIGAVKGYSLLLMENTARERVFTREDCELIRQVGQLALNVLNRHRIEANRATFAAELEDSVRQRTGELETLNAERRRTEMAKSEFLTNVVRELRMPMSAITGMSDLMLDEKLSNRQRRYLEDIKHSSSTLTGHFDDMLDLARLDAGDVRLNPIHFSLQDMIDGIASSIHFSLRGKQVGFVVNSQPEMPVYVCCDHAHLRQILMHLLAHAARGTDSGYIKWSSEADSRNLRFIIEDTGAGFREEDLPLLFTPFTVMSSSETRLGLAVSKGLAELMGGTLSVESKYGQGTIFTLTIPYEIGNEDMLTDVKGGINPVFAPEALVLVVDSNEVNQSVTQGLLQLCRIQCDLALSGVEALAMVRQKTYDLVLLDHASPGSDGIRTTQAIRALGGKYMKLPIVALTANVAAEARELLLRAGLDDLLAKPLEKAELDRLLRTWLPAEKLNAGASHTVSTGAVTGARYGSEPVHGTSRATSRPDALENQLRQVSLRIPATCRLLARYVESRDMKAYAGEAYGVGHALEGIGAHPLSRQAKALEQAARREDIEFCRNNDPVFRNVLMDLRAELKSALPPRNARDAGIDAGQYPVGDSAALREKIEALHGRISAEEREKVSVEIDKLRAFTYGMELDDLLAAVSLSLSLFDHDRAKTILYQALKLFTTVEAD